MKRVRVILGAMTLALVATTAMASAPKPEKSALLDKFKALAGDWVPKEKDGSAQMVINYRVTSGGTAVVETIGAGTKEEMITVITADGDGLALTHYCMLNNQPQMHASKLNGNSIAFDFVRATNMKSDKDMHMHSVTYTFVDKDTLKTTWTNYDKGKDAGKMVFEHVRKK